jgi:hypothetical protein
MRQNFRLQGELLSAVGIVARKADENRPARRAGDD